MNPFKSVRFWLAAFCVSVLAGCSSSYYSKNADRQAYSAIHQKSPLVPNTDPHFTIAQTNVLSLDEFPVATNVLDALGPHGQRERGARILRLEDALAIAVQHSRVYQSRKEQLYLSGLALMLARHQFTPIFSAGGKGTFTGQTEQAVRYEIDSATGEIKPVLSDNLVEQRQVAASGDIGASWLIRGVGQLTTAFTVDFLRFVTGDPRSVTSSRLSAQFTRPLLRNAGYLQQMEALTQAERQMVYDLRDFVRYRRDFSVQIATEYYRVLGLRDAVRNNFLNFQSSQRNAERTRALAQEGRVTQSDLGRLAQQELSSESTWVNSIRNYRQTLDNFKFLMGLTIDENLILDDAELKSLRIRHPDVNPDDSIKVALAARLEFITAKEQLEDAERKVKVAANFLLPQLDLTSSVMLNSDPDKNTGLPLPETDRYRYAASLTLDPGLDKTAAQDAYRTSLITHDRAARQVDQQEDEIKLEVRDSWRSLEQAKRDFEISELGVQIAERRVEEQNLLAELGRAKAQDQVDAQNDLANSKNQRTQALVTHTIARVQFWNRMGILYIKDRGQWEEIKNAKAE